jgi:hypothetical protein
MVDPRDGVRFPRGPGFHEVSPLLEGERLQPVLQAFGCGRRHEIYLQAPQAEDFPDEIYDVANPDILENIGRLHRRGNLGEKLVVVVTLDKRRRPKRLRPPGRLSGGGRGRRWGGACGAHL